jgi:transcriptional regulator with XRE-family HTH domain
VGYFTPFSSTCTSISAMKQKNISNIDQYVIAKVKAKRIKLKISQAQLAYKLDVSEGFIGNIESPNYRAKYNLNHLNELAKIFNCSPQVFLPKKAL